MNDEIVNDVHWLVGFDYKRTDDSVAAILPPNWTVLQERGWRPTVSGSTEDEWWRCTCWDVEAPSEAAAIAVVLEALCDTDKTYDNFLADPALFGLGVPSVPVGGTWSADA